MTHKTFLALFIAFSFFACKEDAQVLTKIEGKQIPITDTLKIDQGFEAIIKPYRDKVNKDMNAVLSYAPEIYSKSNGHLNTAIGNLMADVVYQQGNFVFNKRTGKNIDAVILNHGGIRSVISKGNITTRTAFEVMPFENSIVVVALKGQQMDSMMGYLSHAKRAHPVSGIQLTLDKDFGITESLVQNKPIDAKQTYYLATNDYLYNSSGRMHFFKPNDSLYVLDYKIRNAMIDYFKRVDTIKPVIDDRFTQTK